MEKVQRELKVTAIENGTVIDHIPSNRVFQVIKILNLAECEDEMFLGVNLESKKLADGKGIIKVSNRYFADNEINKISLVAPTATLIEIRNYEVTLKKKVRFLKRLRLL